MVHGMQKENKEKLEDDQELFLKTTCCICYEKYAVEVKLKCNHKFCSSCMTKLFLGASKEVNALQCPYCRKDLSSNILEYEFTLHDNLAELSTKIIQNVFPMLPLCSNVKIDDIENWLKYDIDVNYVNVYTALTSAAIKSNLNILEALITKGANVESLSMFGHTPLMLAAQTGNVEIVKALLQKKAEVNVQKNDGLSALHLASVNSLEIVEILLENGANVDIISKIYGTPIIQAAIYGRLEVVQHLIEKKAHINLSVINGPTPLIAAAEKGHFEIVRVLLQNNANINAQMNGGLSALHVASMNINGCLKIVEILLDNGANVDIISEVYGTPIFLAAMFGYLNIVQYLIEKKADINLSTINGTTPLMAAAEKGHFEIVKALVKSNPELPVTKQRSDGESALSLAELNGHSLVTEFLCEIAYEQM